VLEYWGQNEDTFDRDDAGMLLLRTREYDSRYATQSQTCECIFIIVIITRRSGSLSNLVFCNLKLGVLKKDHYVFLSHVLVFPLKVGVVEGLTN
jgi:hypothetical protein